MLAPAAAGVVPAARRPEFLLAQSALELPAVGPNTVLAAVYPYLYGAVSYAQRERGCALHASLFPYGPDGARAFYESLAKAFGKTVSYAERERQAWEALGSQTEALRGRSIAFCSDAMLELPLARTLRAAGARIALIGTPNPTRSSTPQNGPRSRASRSSSGPTASNSSPASPPPSPISSSPI